MADKKYWVVGTTHIDLAWLRDSVEYSEFTESMVVRMLDLLDSHPGFTYTIEQIAHFRCLAGRRPDLIERIKGYVGKGRVEVAGGMASGIDTNGPNGECFIRNHLLGRRWAEEHFGANVETGYLIDTFGISAQVPQLLRQFGIHHLIANRLGGIYKPEIFEAQGIDGSKILLVGRDGHAPYVPERRFHMRMVRGHQRVDSLFEDAAKSEVEGPHIVIVYDENELVPSIRSDFQIQKQNSSGNGTWCYGTCRDFLSDLETCGDSWPVVPSDLNPAFTGTYGLRPIVRLRNRRIEGLLIEAEKWALLAGLENWKKRVADAWWHMSYVQSHDVYTGSMPTYVWQESMGWLDEVENTAESLLHDALGSSTPDDSDADREQLSILVANGLPWERSDVTELALPAAWPGVGEVRNESENIPFEISNGKLRILAQTPAVGASAYTISQGPAPAAVDPKTVKKCAIENDHLRVELSEAGGIERILCKESGRIVAEQCGGLVTVQHDTGSYQIANPVNAELPAIAGSIRLFPPQVTDVGQRVVIEGSFPNLKWAGPGNRLDWKLELFLAQGKPRLDLAMDLDWVGEASRIRMRLPTNIADTRGIYEIPFGTIRRSPYSVRHSCSGEWPAHRFVALEDKGIGIAVVNCGSHGVETVDGAITTTLLRAPAITQTAMAPDDTSSQHGRHHFRFAVVPYTGAFAKSPVLEQAQEVNTPLTARFAQSKPRFPIADPLFALEPRTCVLSAIKSPEDDAGDEMIVRIYESTGARTTAKLRIRGLRQAWESDLLESRGVEIASENESIEIPLNPFEIKTVRIARDPIL